MILYIYIIIIFLIGTIYIIYTLRNKQNTPSNITYTSANLDISANQPIITSPTTTTIEPTTTTVYLGPERFLGL